MTTRKLVYILIAILFILVWATYINAAEAKRPLLLLFETSKGEGVDNQLVESTTKALRTYLRETQQIEVALFDRESPTVTRAIMENKLTADKVASYASQAERLEVAKLLGFQYVAGAEVSVKDVAIEAGSNTILAVKDDTTTQPDAKEKSGTDKPESETKNIAPKALVGMLELKLWVAQVNNPKQVKWESTGKASAAGAGARDIDNAMQSAASYAVNDIARQAFGELPRIPELGPTSGNETTAIYTDQPAKATSLNANEYVARGDQSLKAGNIALAIRQYSQAVNADPSNGSLRIKLADAYAHRAMYTEAEDTLEQADAVGADKNAISEVKTRIEKLKNGEQESTVSGINSRNTNGEQESSVSGLQSRNNTKTAIADAPAVIKSTPGALAKMVEGDKLWGDGKPDEAAAAYTDSIKLNPADWRAYERLAIVNASMSLFGESRKALDQLAQVQRSPSSKILENRYEMLRKSFDKHFGGLIDQFSANAADFDKRIITRESYYSSIKGLTIRLEAMAGFLDAINVPQTKQTAHLRRSLACGLAAQAASSLLDYLETNNEKSKSNADVFLAKAKSELEAAAKLEESK